MKRNKKKDKSPNDKIVSNEEECEHLDTLRC